jgi:Flp pilus assembly protein CpaB
MSDEANQGLVTKKDWRVLVIALVLGAAAVVLLNIYINARQRGEKLVSVLVAKQRLESGVQLDASMLEEAKLPAGAVPGRVARPGDKAILLGEYLGVGLDKGQPLYTQFVTSTVFTDSLSRSLIDDERAYCISFDNPLTEAVVPGSRIDIYGSFLRDGKTHAFQLYEDGRVLMRIGRFLVLALTPVQALTLQVARQNVTQMVFAIRKPGQEGGTDYEVSIDDIKSLNRGRPVQLPTMRGKRDEEWNVRN